MDTAPDRARVRYVVEVWVDVDLPEGSVDQVVVDTAGLSNPLELRSTGGRRLTSAESAVVLDIVASDTWPSWDYV
jgi:hypothetical protein